MNTVRTCDLTHIVCPWCHDRQFRVEYELIGRTVPAPQQLTCRTCEKPFTWFIDVTVEFVSYGEEPAGMPAAGDD